MASDLVRTADDDVSDALAALDAAEREITTWRAHLARMAGTDPAVGVAHQARRCSKTVAAHIGDATVRTIDLRRHAEDSEPQLRSVS